MAYTTFKAWNDDYTKLLQKRNKIERELDAAWCSPVATRDRLATRLEKANAAVEHHRTREDRPASSTMSNMIRSA